MSSTPWSNETERADYYQTEYNKQLVISKKLEIENECLKSTIESLAKELEDNCDDYD